MHPQAGPFRTLLLVGLLTVPASGGIPDALSDPARVGAWNAVMPWTIEGVHAALLPTGKVLVWQTSELAGVWDPETGELRSVALEAPFDIFCSGHTLLPDGRVLVVGGEAPLGPMHQGNGHPATFFFDPWLETWSRGPDMAEGRWYPGVLLLADGAVLAMSGWIHPGQTNARVERLEPGGEWTALAGADRSMALYPRLHLLPDGRVARVGTERQTVYFLPEERAWVPGPSRVWGERYGGASVLLPGLDRVLVAGGHPFGEASAGVARTAEILDPTGAWRPTAPMAHERVHGNLVLLPDGSVLAAGGDTSFRDNLLDPIPPEIFDPPSETWTAMAPAARPRNYHSTALLLPDASVLLAGGNWEGPEWSPLRVRTAEVFNPPYLFKGQRPLVREWPESVAYGDSFGIEARSKDGVQMVVLVRPGSVTHSTNFDQRLVELVFEAAAGGLHVQAPSNPAEAPPGWYMLFLVSGKGVPSVARFVHLAG